MEKRPNKSDLYQHLYNEIAVSEDILAAFQNDDSISARLNPFEYNEELLDLEDQLKKEFWRVVNTLLTERQRDVLRLCADGYTQMEIAKMLNVNQSSVTKSIHGNAEYGNDNTTTDSNNITSTGKKKRRVYGGSKKKLALLVENDEKIQSILAQMIEIRSEKW